MRHEKPLAHGTTSIFGCKLDSCVNRVALRRKHRVNATSVSDVSMTLLAYVLHATILLRTS